MYEIRANVPVKELGDQILDELITLFDAHQQDCTSGIVHGNILGYVNQDLLSAVTTLLLKHVPSVEVKLATPDEELEFA